MNIVFEEHFALGSRTSSRYINCVSILALSSVNHRLVARSVPIPIVPSIKSQSRDVRMTPLSDPPPLTHGSTTADYTIALCLRLIITCTAGMLMPGRESESRSSHLLGTLSYSREREKGD